ncbi:MAG: hypothetical protein Q8N84_01400 [bacterium]|nr:hypothetical protein [bacterium]
MLKNRYKIVVSALASLLMVFYLFNFIPRNVMLLASRTPTRQVLDYLLNSALFFVGIYLLLSLVAFVTKKVFPRSKQ